MFPPQNDWHIHLSSLAGRSPTAFAVCSVSFPTRHCVCSVLRRAFPAGAAYLPTMSTRLVSEVAMPKSGWPASTEQCEQPARTWGSLQRPAPPRARRAMTRTYWLRSESRIPDWFRIGCGLAGAVPELTRALVGGRPTSPRKERGRARHGEGRDGGRARHGTEPCLLFPFSSLLRCPPHQRRRGVGRAVPAMLVGGTGTTHAEFSNSLFIFQFSTPHPKVSVPSPFWNQEQTDQK